MAESLYRDLLWLPRCAGDFAAACSAALEAPAAAGARIRQLASRALGDNDLIRLSRVIGRARRSGISLQPLAPFRLGLLGNSTTDFITAAVTATGPRHGFDIECIAGGYDQAVQESSSPDSKLNRSAPDAVLIALDWRALPLRSRVGDADEARAAVDESIQLLRAILDGVRANSGAVCLVQTVAPPPECLFGSLDRGLRGTRWQMIDAFNQALRESVAGSGDVIFDVAALAETVGLANWHSPAQWHLAKLPFAQEFLPLYAERVCNLVAALRGRSRRCLALDLDNTLWGGVIGDDGIAGIHCVQGDALGEAYLEFQRFLLSLRERGVLLAVCSKNDDETARLPFRHHPDMLIREEHIVVFQANWSDKPANLQAICKELNLGLESLVFVDDNPFERELVRKTLPEVAVPEMPDDPAGFARTLSAAAYFELPSFSAEDAARADYYAGNARRAVLQSSTTDLQAYIASLDMSIYFRPFDAVGRARITQLINKTNQFNLTTRRYSETAMARMEEDAACFTLQARLTDRFGDNGMISVVVCRSNEKGVWDIDVWLMSCRVLGRGVERAVLAELLRHASEQRVHTLRGSYIPSGRNTLVENHYRDLGFELCERTAAGGSVWRLDVATARVEDLPLRVHSDGFSRPVSKAVTASRAMG